MRDPRLHLGLGLEGVCRVGTLAGEKLKDGLVESEKLDAPIFSPATKAETGHDENITVARVREILGNDVAEKLESMARTGL
jgi:phosphoribosylaminoimidazole-succinocarboxamide synthase